MGGLGVGTRGGATGVVTAVSVGVGVNNLKIVPNNLLELLNLHHRPRTSILARQSVAYQAEKFLSPSTLDANC